MKKEYESMKKIIKNLDNHFFFKDKDYKLFTKLYKKNFSFTKFEKEKVFMMSIMHGNFEVFKLLFKDSDFFNFSMDFAMMYAPMVSDKETRINMVRLLIESEKVIVTPNVINNCRNYGYCSGTISKLLYKKLDNNSELKKKGYYLTKLQEEKNYINITNIILNIPKDIKFLILIYSDDFYQTDNEIYSLIE